jgi:sugar lactone lactonase YvrE
LFPTEIEEGFMSQRRSKRAGSWWLLLLPIAVVVAAGRTSGTIAAARAGEFPAFIAMPDVSPRGVAVDKVGNVYVSVGEVRSNLEYIQVRKFTPDGALLFSEEIGQGTIGGLMATANGDLYIAVAAGAARGVYRMDREGQIELLPGSNQIFFANGLAFDDAGTLYITESVSIPPATGQGGIWRIPRGGEAELCLRDALLTGTGVLNQPVPIGANGIAYYHGDLYVTNTEKGTVLRMSVWPDGRLEVPEVWTTLEEVPESPLAGAPLPVAGDGIALDVHGNLYVAVLTRSAVVRINISDKSQETVAAFRLPNNLPLYAPLDFPASLFFGTGKGERTNLFVTNLGLGGWVGPGLVKADAGVQGRPLH